MDYQVVLTSRARADLRAIATYIARNDAVAALRFTGRLLDHAKALNRTPFRGSPVRQRTGVRRILHSPYLIYYRVEEDSPLIRVLRFWHGARDPKKLRFDG